MKFDEFCNNLRTGRNIIHNKNAFQWGAYYPLVDRILACTMAGGYLLGVYLSGGEPAWGVYLLEGVPARGCTCPGEYLLGVYLPGQCTSLGGVPAQGVYLIWGCTCLGECTCLGGVPAWGNCLGGVPTQGGTCPGTPPCEQNDWQTGVKT